jgi:hypothetical protein
LGASADKSKIPPLPNKVLSTFWRSERFAPFSESSNWDLITKHWEDLMQVVLSTHTEKISSAMLLRKLSYSSEKNKLFLVAEVGHLIRCKAEDRRQWFLRIEFMIILLRSVSTSLFTGPR